MVKNDIIQSIHQWDQKHVVPLELLYQRLKDNESFFDHLFDLMLSDERFQDACTWLLKHHRDQGASFNNLQTIQIINLFYKLTNWGSILHVLQIIPQLDLNEIDHQELYDKIKMLTTHDQKFVRAWSYNALYVLSQRFDYKTNDTINALLDAQKHESASVKARIRNILK